MSEQIWLTTTSKQRVTQTCAADVLDLLRRRGAHHGPFGRGRHL